MTRVRDAACRSAGYAYHLAADYRDAKGQKAIGAQLQALRVAAGDPTSELLQAMPTMGAREGIHRSSQDYTPKIAAALRLIEQILRAREQAINRVHRMTSPKPVKVWSIVAEGTIDRRLESLLHEKGDSAELVLDGKLLRERTEEVNLAELLSSAASEFDESSKTLGEAALLDEWPALEERLQSAMADWRRPASVSIGPGVGGRLRSCLPRWKR